MNENKIVIKDIFCVGAIITLIAVRFLVSEDNCLWINAINFSGIIMACLSLYFYIFKECKELKKINLFTGVSVCILAVLVIVEILVILNLIKFSNLWNDVITLVVLLISLPEVLYKRIFIKILK